MSHSTPSFLRRILLLGSSAASFTFFTCSAATVWDAGSTTDLLWSNAANWGGTEPDGLDDVILPKPIPNPGTLTDPNIITLSAGELANSLSFFGPYTLTGGTLALTTGQIAVTIGNASTIESQLTGSGGLLKINDGALKLTNAANDYTGTTQIDAGSVIITDQGALGSDASAIIVTGNVTRGVGGGSLVLGSGNNNLDGLTFTRDLSLTGGGASGDGAAFNSVGNNIFTGTILTGNNPTGLNPVGGTPITASATRLASTFGTATVNGVLTVGPSGQSTEFTGNGNWVINSNIDGAGHVIKSGNGLMILSGSNTFGGVLQLSGGFARVSSQANLGNSTANNAIFLTNGGKLEIRTDTPDFTTAKRVQLNTGTTTGTFYLDREIGGSGLNQDVTLGLFTLAASTSARTLVIDGRNGYNLSFSGNMATGSSGNLTITNNGNGLFTNIGNFYNTTNGTVRTLAFGGNGDFLITGGILASGNSHIVTKTGTGTLTLNGTNSTFSGALNVNGGTVAINDFRAITNNTADINIGSTTTTGTLAVIGNNLSGANVTSEKTISLAGITGGAILLADQTGTSPGLRLNGAVSVSEVGSKTLTLGGSNAQDNTISGVISDSSVVGTTKNSAAYNNTNTITLGSVEGISLGASISGLGIPGGTTITAINTGTRVVTLSASTTGGNRGVGQTITVAGVENVTSVTKTGSGTWVLAGANTYTGTTNITAGILKLEANGAVSTVLPIANNVTFGNNNINAGGTLELVGQPGVNNVQTLGTLAYSNGSSTVRLTPGLLGSASLVFDNMNTTGGATVNFVGGDFTANTITINNINNAFGSDGIITRSVYWNGADFAYREGGVLRAPQYGVDADTATSGTSLTVGEHNEVTGSFATSAVTIDSLKINGGHTLTINSGQTLTVSNGGVLVTGGNAVITGGTALGITGTNALVVRVDGGADLLRIESIISGGSGGLTKAGAGVLVLAGLNAQTGATNIGEGTVRLADGGRLSANNQTLTMRQDTFLDLNGVSTGSSIGQFNNNGTVTNTSGADVLLTIGNGVTTNGTAGTSFGIIEDGAGGGRTSLFVNTNNNNAAQNTTFVLNGLSTYSGTTTLNKSQAGNLIVTAPTLTNIGQPSSIGTGDATNDATNAASLIFSGAASATQVFATLNYNGRDSISTDRLFTFGGSVNDSGARIRANGVNDATLVFSNPGALAFANPDVNHGLALGGASIGSNQFNPQITNNGSGVVSLYKQDAGLWILGNSANSYTGVTQINAGALRAEGTTLPDASTLVFNGGVLQSSGTFTRSLTTTPAAGAGGVNWSGNGGFAASTDKLTVNIGGNDTPDTLQWGVGGFVSGSLILSSTTAFAEVDILNSIDLSGADRTIQVDTNGTTNSDLATLTGVISNSTGTAGIVKTGGGILRLLADNSYNGNTNINGGTVRAVNIGNSTSLSSNFGAGAGKISLGTGSTSGTLAYVGGGEITDREINLAGTTASVILESSGTGPLVLTNVVNTSTGTGAKTLFLRGDLNASNEVSSVLTDNSAGGVLNVTKDDNGTWILSGQSTFTGNMTVSAGPLGISADSVGPVGAVTSSPVGATRLIISNGSLFALDGDRTLNTTVRLNSNASSNFIGINSITLNDIETTTGGTMTVTNMLPTGKLLTLNSPTFSNTETATARLFQFNGSGDTILNASVTNGNDGTGGVISLTYNGHGSLTLGGSNGASTYTGATTISGGTLRVGSADAIPNGPTASDVTMNPAAGLTATLDLNGFDQTINGLVANSLGTANIDNTSVTAATFTFGSQDRTVSLIGNVMNAGTGPLSLTKTGAEIATLTGGTYAHTGATTVNGGTLTFGGDVTATTGISVTGGSILNINGGFSGSVGVTTLTVGGGSTLSLSLDSAGTPLSNLMALDLGAGTGTALLRLNVGDLNTAGDNLGTDMLTLLATGSLSLGNTITFNMSDSGLNQNQTYTLLNLVDGGLNAFGFSNVIQGTTPGGFDDYDWIVTDKLVQLHVGNLVTGDSYWNGATGTAWNLATTQWADDKAGTTPSITVPGAGTDVIFGTNAGPSGALVTTLEQNFKINSLTFEAGTTTPSSIAIDSGADPTYRLQVAPQMSTDGVKITAGGPAAVTISAPFRLGADQTWSVADPGSVLTFSGPLQGEQDLTISGAGSIVLSAAAAGTFNPGLSSDITINGGTVEIQNAGAFGTTILANAANLVINSGASFYYNGAAATVNNPITLGGGTLSAGTANQIYNGGVNVTTDSFINLRNNNSASTDTTSRNITLSGPLAGTGKLSLDSIDTVSNGNQFTGTLILNQDNSGWSGGFDINRGTIQVTTNLNAFGTGDVTASAGRIQFNLPANNTVDLGQAFTVDASGGVLELSVDAQGTLSGDLTVNLNGVVTLGSVANANNALRITQNSDNFSVLNITNSVVLGNDASITYQGNAARPFEITGVISETGGSRSLAINDELGGWTVTSRTIRLSGANTFTGDISLTEGVLEFSTVSDIGGAASNLGQGSGITLAGGTFNFVGDTTSKSTNRPIDQTGAATFAANGTNGATITYAGPITSGANAITLTGSGTGIFSGTITQTGTAADVLVNSGTWHIAGVGSNFADDVIVTATSTGTAVLNLDATGVLTYTAGTSNGLYARDGGVINLNADDVNGVGNSGNLSFILLGDTPTNSQPGTLNTNTFNISTPRIDVGGLLPGRTGIVSGTGTVTATYTGTDYAQGFRFFAGSVSANLAGVSTILKQSLDPVTLSGDNSGLVGTVGNTRIDSGTLILDYTTSNTNKLPSNRAVDLRGGTLQVVGNNGAATAETLSALTLASGGSSEIQVTGGTGQDAVLALGAITRGNRAADGTMRFILPSGAQTATNGIRTTSANSTSGLLGSGTTTSADSAYATVDDGTGVWFATKNTAGSSLGNVVALISTAKDDLTTWLPGEHITDSTGFFGTLECANINSLRFDAAAGSDLVVGEGVTFTIASGGILVTSNVGNSPTIIGGNLVSGAGEVIVTHDSPVTFEISSNIRGDQALTKTGTGTLLLTGSNTYTDETEIQEGILQVNGTSIGDSSPVNLSDDHASTLQLLNSEAIGRLTGGSASAGLDTLALVDIGTNTLTLNSSVGNATYAGKISGSGTLVKNNSGTNTDQIFTGASTDFNGTVIVNGGLFRLYQLGAMNATDYIVNSGGSLLIDNNSTTSTGARILDTASITLNSADGARSGETKPTGLAIFRDQNSAQNETVGVITVRSGASYARLEATNAGTSSSTQLIANDIVRENNATLNVRGTNLGNASGRRTLLRIGDATNQTAFIDAMVGGGGALGSTSLSIVPWAIAQDVTNAGVGDTHMGNSLATYISGRGFRALDLTTEYTTIAGAGSTDNARQSLATDLTGVAGKTLNALVIDNNATSTVKVTGAGAGQTLDNTSGAFLFTLSNGSNSTAYGTILSGFDSGITVGSTNEYVFTVQNPSSATTTPTLTATVESPLNSTADITKSGRGTLIFTAVNAAGGGANKTTINEGTLEIAGLDNIGGATGEVVFAGGTLRLGANFTDDLSTRSITLLNGGGTINTNGNDVSLANSIGVGVGSLTKAGTGTLTFAGTNDTAHQGLIQVTGGTLALNQTPGTAAIGSGGVQIRTSTGVAILQLVADDQIADTVTVDLAATNGFNALFDVNNRSETIGGLDMSSATTGGATVKTGATGVLTLAGDVFLNNIRTADASTTEFQMLITGSGSLSSRTTDGFLDLGGVTRTITVETTQANPTRNDAVIETVIQSSGAAGIIKEGSRTLYLRAANTYSGPTVINDGTISISSAVNLGDGSVTNSLTIRNGATLQSTGASVILGQAVQIDGSGATVDVSGGATNALVFTSVISGHDCAPLTKTGVGALALMNSNTYEGGTIVSGGSLIVANTTGSATGLGSVTVQSSTILGGDGFIAPAANNNVTIAGQLLVGDPTASTGTDLSIVTSGAGMVSFGALSTTTFDLWSGVGSGVANGPGAADLLILGGSNGVSLGGTLEVVNSSGSMDWAKFDEWKIIDWTALMGGAEAPGTGSNLFASITLPTLTPGFVWDTTGLYTTGSIIVVPEPSRFLLLGVGLILTLFRRRR